MNECMCFASSRITQGARSGSRPGPEMDLDLVILDLGAWQCRAAVRRAGSEQFSEPVIVPTMLGKPKGSKKILVADEVVC